MQRIIGAVLAIMVLAALVASSGGSAAARYIPLPTPSGTITPHCLPGSCN